jgi:predicted dehydrogenase
MRKWPLSPPLASHFSVWAEWVKLICATSWDYQVSKSSWSRIRDWKLRRRGKALAGAEEATTDVERAINSSSVDAVVIVTPTNTHARLLEVAAKAGKAAFTEKPIALDLAETARVVNLIREAGIPVQLGFMRRFDPGYARAKQKIDTGELGRIELFRALSRDTYPPSLEFLRGRKDASRRPARKTLWKPFGWRWQ